MDLQAVAMKSALDPIVPPHVKAALMRAWVDLEEIRLTLKGHGKPKPVEARNAQPKRKTKPGAVAPIVYPAPSG